MEFAVGAIVFALGVILGVSIHKAAISDILNSVSDEKEDNGV